MFSIKRKGKHVAMPSKTLIVRRADRFPTTFFVTQNVDFRDYDVRLGGVRSLQGQVLTMFDFDDHFSMRNELLGKSLLFRLFAKLAIDEAQGVGIHLRYLTEEQLLALGGVTGTLQAINAELSRPLVGVDAISKRWAGLDACRFDTLGQLLVAIFSLRRLKRPDSRGGPLRQMLSFLTKMCMVDDDMRILLLASLYNWAYLGTCNSCFDIVLMNSSTTKYEYSMLSLSVGVDRPLSVVSTPELNYKIEEHSTPREHIPVAWQVFEHGWLQLKNRNSSLEFRYSETGDSKNYEIINIPLHWGMSFLKLQEAIHRGAKGAINGRGNRCLVLAIRAMRVSGSDFSALKEMLVDVYLILEHFPRLLRLCRNIIGIISSASIAESLLPSGADSSTDLYGSLMMNMVRKEIKFYCDLYSFICPPGSTVSDVLDNLADDRIRNAWIVYMDSDGLTADSIKLDV